MKVVWLLLATLFVDVAIAAEAGPQPSALSQGLLLGGFIAIFYFLIWRPQSKRAKEHRKLISNLAKGDEVVTSGGILGKITKISNDFIVLMVAEGIEISLQKNAIVQAVPKGTLKSI